MFPLEGVRVVDWGLSGLNPPLRFASVREDSAERPGSQEVVHPVRRTEEDPGDKVGTRTEAEAVRGRDKRVVPVGNRAVLLTGIRADPPKQAGGRMIVAQRFNHILKYV